MKFESKEKLEKYIDVNTIKFLKEYKIYNEFLFELKKWIKNKPNQQKVRNPIIINSFFWADTEKGDLFWCNVEHNFYKKYKDLDKPGEAILCKDLKKLL